MSLLYLSKKWTRKKKRYPLLASSSHLRGDTLSPSAAFSAHPSAFPLVWRAVGTFNNRELFCISANFFSSFAQIQGHFL
jgi:hypothetical protein